MDVLLLLQAVLLGIVQGIAEFLPISSSGHLVVLQHLFERLFPGSASSEHLLMNVTLHVGTLGSILVVYRNDLRRLVFRPRLCLQVIVATIPAAVVGLMLKSYLEEAFESPVVVACGWLMTAAFLLTAQRFERDEVPIDSMTFRQSLVVGMFQALALVPGLSRSGSTISAGLYTGLTRTAAAEFSFLIAIPVIAGAAAVESRPLWQAWLFGGSEAAVTAPSSLLPLAVGMLTAFVVGIAALRGLLAMIARRRLHWFAWYCVLAAVVTLVGYGLS
jgi:undecaprenyl-diphosphatase